MTRSIFDAMADELERLTDLEKLEARGTLRIALKQGGLEARSVTAEQMRVVIRKLMPTELGARGVSDPEEVCATLGRSLDSLAGDGEPGSASPEEVFRRLAGS